MDIFADLWLGLSVAVSPMNMLYLLIGAMVGMVVGVIPGFGPSAGLAILLPVTFGMDPIGAVMMLAAIYYGAMYGGTITSILLNTPGESATVASTFDGFPLAQQGRAGPALVMQAAASFVGGTAILEGADDETVLMALTRSGWSNPGAARPRAELQRVEYVLREGSLIRRSRPFLDAVEATPRTEQVLLAGVEAADMRFFDGDSWRPGFSAPSGQPGPRAVRLEMIHPRFGPLRQDFLAGPRS